MLKNLSSIDADKLFAFVASVIALAILTFVNLGGLDYLLNVSLLETVASNFNSSYSDAKRILKPGDSEWGPTLKLITDSTTAHLPNNKMPMVIARDVAIQSSKQDLGNGHLAEWTAPSTPLMVLYKDWPGNTLTLDDYKIVGTIGDLKAWIEQYRNRWKFYITDLLFALLSVVTATLSLAPSFALRPSRDR